MQVKILPMRVYTENGVFVKIPQIKNKRNHILLLLSVYKVTHKKTNLCKAGSNLIIDSNHLLYFKLNIKA